MDDTSTGRRPWERPRDRTGWLPFDSYSRLVRLDAARLREVAELGLDAPVPSCPGWTVEDVVSHTAEVYLHKVACTRLRASPDPWPPAEHASADPMELFDAGLADLLLLFAEQGPEAPSHTWWPPDQSLGFWYRRMALETAVHRMDVELAHAVPTPVDSALALDGIDELLVMMLAGDEWAEEGTRSPVDATVRISSQGRSWTVQADASAVLVDRSASGEATAEVAGEPSEVLLWLWGRAGDSSLLVTGDASAASALRARIAEATG
jgi:uncharacterized protein (TIGR03083 family)